jgi:hypothetical protein
MPSAGRAQQVAGHLARFLQVHNDLEREAILDQINALYPDFDCRHHKTYGLGIFVKPTAAAVVPTSLAHFANVIIEVDSNGFGKLRKCKAGAAGERMTAVDLAKSFGFPLAVPDSLRLTRWAAIEEDWI